MGNDVTIGDVYEAIGAHATGRMSDEDFAELESVASPGAGACGGQFTANTMAMAFEVLGISPMAQNLVPAQDPTKAEVAYEAGKLVVDVLRARPAPERDHHQGGARERRSPASPARAARPTPSCTCSRSRARSASSSTSTTSTASASARRCCATSSPAASTSPSTSTRPAASRSCSQRLQEAGLLNEDTITVTGQTIGELAKAANETEGQRVVRGARRAAEGHRRPGHPARQPRARGLRHQARRPREAPPRRPRARLRRRGGGVRRRHQRPDRGRRRRRHPQRGPGRRPGHARDARRHRRPSTARAWGRTSRC